MSTPFKVIESEKTKISNVALFIPLDREDSLEDVAYELNSCLDINTMIKEQDNARSIYVVIMQLKDKANKTFITEQLPTSWNAEVMSISSWVKGEDYMSFLKGSNMVRNETEEIVDRMDEFARDLGQQEINRGRQVPQTRWYKKSEDEERMDRIMELEESRRLELKRLKDMGISTREARRMCPESTPDI